MGKWERSIGVSSLIGLFTLTALAAPGTAAASPPTTPPPTEFTGCITAAGVPVFVKAGPLPLMPCGKLKPFHAIAQETLGGVGPMGPPGADGQDGAPGADGQDGAPGQDGADGLNCWDSDGDGVKDPEEDLDNNGVHDAADCRGPRGATGPQGPPGSGGGGSEPDCNPFALRTPANFRGCDLSDLSFRGIPLVAADVSDTVLVRGFFAGTAGMGASFRQADIPDAIFDEGVFTGATFLGVCLDDDPNGGTVPVVSQLCEFGPPASFHGAKLDHGSIAFAWLQDADLGEADLTWTDAFCADLTGASLVGANLSAANLHGVKGLTPDSTAGAVWSTQTTCPDGSSGHSTCSGHLTPNPGDCLF